MLPRTKKILIGGVALAAALALPALAQDQPESLLPPGFGDPTPAPQPATNEAQPSEAPGRQQPPSEGGGEALRPRSGVALRAGPAARLRGRLLALRFGRWGGVLASGPGGRPGGRLLVG